jgi:hypothetical protein
MTLIVEDGTGLTTANSYVSEAEADAYFEIVPAYSDVWAAYTATEKENLLRMATRVLDARTSWEGHKQVDESALRWPRKHVRDRDGLLVDSDLVPSGSQGRYLRAGTHHRQRGYHHWAGCRERPNAEAGCAGDRVSGRLFATACPPTPEPRSARAWVLHVWHHRVWTHPEGVTDELDRDFQGRCGDDHAGRW